MVVHDNHNIVCEHDGRFIGWYVHKYEYGVRFREKPNEERPNLQRVKDLNVVFQGVMSD